MWRSLVRILPLPIKFPFGNPLLASDSFVKMIHVVSLLIKEVKGEICNRHRGSFRSHVIILARSYISPVSGIKRKGDVGQCCEIDLGIFSANPIFAYFTRIYDGQELFLHWLSPNYDCTYTAAFSKFQFNFPYTFLCKSRVKTTTPHNHR